MKLTKKDDSRVDIATVQGKTWSIFFKVKDETSTVIDITNNVIYNIARIKYELKLNL